MAVKPIPDQYHTVTPYLMPKGANRLIEFAKSAFGAIELFRMPGQNGKVMHAEIKVGDSVLMLSDGDEQHGPQPANLMIYVENCDETFRKAVQAGARVIREPADQFYGDRSGAVEDPSGITWHISTHVEDLSIDQIKERMPTAS